MADRMIRIDVTQELIDQAAASGHQGARCNPAACPVNLAAEIAFGVPCRTFWPYIAVGSDEQLAWMPRDAQDRVYAYDVGRGMTPFAFDVPDPRPSVHP